MKQDKNLITVKDLSFEFSKKEAGKLVAFVHNGPNGLEQVGERSKKPKKVVVVSAQLADKVKPFIGYDCELKKMVGYNGYIAVGAYVVPREAFVTISYCPKTLYQVVVSVGNQQIVMDLMGNKKSSTIQGFTDMLSKRTDITNLMEANDIVWTCYQQLRQRMEADGVLYVVNGKEVKGGY